MAVFFISDTHFNHDNVITYENRPFNNVEEMNEAIINNWNSVVGKNDIVYHLGDFILHYDNIHDIVDRLNGKIILLRGNHDGKSISYYNKLGFECVKTYTKLDEYKFILSHRPLNDYDIPFGYVNIHGHIHSKKLNSDFNPNLHYNVSVENINYKPIKVEELLKLVQKYSTLSKGARCYEKNNICSK